MSNICEWSQLSYIVQYYIFLFQLTSDVNVI